ncbi:MAG: H-NS histone family protein [Alphaproteobacteria bacterium]|nr:H-NS histone family protein [Alphaproteobacteria bacterium]
MRQVNVDKLSLKELMELDLKVQKAIAVAKERERAELKAKIEKMVAESGFAVSDLFGTGRGAQKGRTVAPKYVNPDNASETWTGRGRKPKWLVAKLNKGGSLDKFLI